MSARFHLSASGVFARSRSCAPAEGAVAAARVQMAKTTPVARIVERDRLFIRLFYDGRPALFSRPMRWISRGDIDGFFGLALDNLVQLLLIDTLCRLVLGFPSE